MVVYYIIVNVVGMVWKKIVTMIPFSDASPYRLLVVIVFVYMFVCLFVLCSGRN